MQKNLIMIAIWAILLGSCTPVKFYSDPEMKSPTGLKLYTAKPFLLAEREAESGRLVKSTVIYLPDLSHPQYMAVKNAPGSSKTDLKLSDGILTAFGFEYEQMLPESVEAVAALLSKTAGAVEDLNGLKGTNGLRATANTVQLYEIVIEPESTWLREITVINK